MAELPCVVPLSKKHIYDGLFSSPPPPKKRTESPLSFRIDDYLEIFSPSNASLGLSIPALDLPAAIDQTDSSTIDYAGVFGGVGDDRRVEDQLFRKSKRKSKRDPQPSRISAHTKDTKSRDLPCDSGNDQASTSPEKAEIPPPKSEQVCASANSIQGSSSVASTQPCDAVKDVDGSIDKTSQWSKDSTDGTANIAGLHSDVPEYTHRIDEVGPTSEAAGLVEAERTRTDGTDKQAAADLDAGLKEEFDDASCSTRERANCELQTCTVSNPSTSLELYSVNNEYFRRSSSLRSKSSKNTQQSSASADSSPLLEEELNVNSAADHDARMSTDGTDKQATDHDAGLHEEFDTSCSTRETANCEPQTCSLSNQSSSPELYSGSNEYFRRSSSVRSKSLKNIQQSSAAAYHDAGLQEELVTSCSVKETANCLPRTCSVSILYSSPELYSGSNDYFRRSSSLRSKSSKNIQRSSAAADSVPLLEDELDVNSAAAVSAAAMKRAIEEAEARIRSARDILKGKDIDGSGRLSFKKSSKFIATSNKSNHSYAASGLNGSSDVEATMQNESVYEDKVLEQKDDLKIKFIADGQFEDEAGVATRKHVAHWNTCAPEGYEETHEYVHFAGKMYSHEVLVSAETSHKHEGLGEWEATKHLSQLFTGVKNRFVSFISKQADAEKTVLQEDETSVSGSSDHLERSTYQMHDVDAHISAADQGHLENDIEMNGFVIVSSEVGESAQVSDRESIEIHNLEEIAEEVIVSSDVKTPSTGKSNLPEPEEESDKEEVQEFAEVKHMLTQKDELQTRRYDQQERNCEENNEEEEQLQDEGAVEEEEYESFEDDEDEIWRQEEGCSCNETGMAENCEKNVQEDTKAAEGIPTERVQVSTKECSEPFDFQDLKGQATTCSIGIVDLNSEKPVSDEHKVNDHTVIEPKVNDEKPVIETKVSDEQPIIETKLNDEQKLVIEPKATEEQPIIEPEVNDEQPSIETKVNDDEHPKTEPKMKDEKLIIESKVNDEQGIIKPKLDDEQPIIVPVMTDEQQIIEPMVNDEKTIIQFRVLDEQLNIEPWVTEKQLVIEPKVKDEQPIIESKINDGHPKVNDEQPITEPKLNDEQLITEPRVNHEQLITEAKVNDEQPTVEPLVNVEQPAIKPNVNVEQPICPDVANQLVKEDIIEQPRCSFVVADNFPELDQYFHAVDNLSEQNAKSSLSRAGASGYDDCKQYSQDVDFTCKGERMADSTSTSSEAKGNLEQPRTMRTINELIGKEMLEPTVCSDEAANETLDHNECPPRADYACVLEDQSYLDGKNKDYGHTDRNQCGHSVEFCFEDDTSKPEWNADQPSCVQNMTVTSAAAATDSVEIEEEIEDTPEVSSLTNILKVQQEPNLNGSSNVEATVQNESVYEDKVLEQKDDLKIKATTDGQFEDEAGVATRKHVAHWNTCAPQGFEETREYVHFAESEGKMYSHEVLVSAETSHKHEGLGEWEATKQLSQLFTGVKNRFVSFISKQADAEKMMLQEDEPSGSGSSEHSERSTCQLHDVDAHISAADQGQLQNDVEMNGLEVGEGAQNSDRVSIEFHKLEEISEEVTVTLDVKLPSTGQSNLSDPEKELDNVEVQESGGVKHKLTQKAVKIQMNNSEQEQHDMNLDTTYQTRAYDQEERNCEENNEEEEQLQDEGTVEEEDYESFEDEDEICRQEEGCSCNETEMPMPENCEENVQEDTEIAEDILTERVHASTKEYIESFDFQDVKGTATTGPIGVVDYTSEKLNVYELDSGNTHGHVVCADVVSEHDESLVQSISREACLHIERSPNAQLMESSSEVEGKTTNLATSPIENKFNDEHLIIEPNVNAEKTVTETKLNDEQQPAIEPKVTDEQPIAEPKVADEQPSIEAKVNDDDQPKNEREMKDEQLIIESKVNDEQGIIKPKFNDEQPTNVPNVTDVQQIIESGVTDNQLVIEPKVNDEQPITESKVNDEQLIIEVNVNDEQAILEPEMPITEPKVTHEQPNIEPKVNDEQLITEPKVNHEHPITEAKVNDEQPTTKPSVNFEQVICLEVADQVVKEDIIEQPRCSFDVADNLPEHSHYFHTVDNLCKQDENSSLSRTGASGYDDGYQYSQDVDFTSKSEWMAESTSTSSETKGNLTQPRFIRTINELIGKEMLAPTGCSTEVANETLDHSECPPRADYACFMEDQSYLDAKREDYGHNDRNQCDHNVEFCFEDDTAKPEWNVEQPSCVQTMTGTSAAAAGDSIEIEEEIEDTHEVLSRTNILEVQQDPDLNLEQKHVDEETFTTDIGLENQVDESLFGTDTGEAYMSSDQDKTMSDVETSNKRKRWFEKDEMQELYQCDILIGDEINYEVVEIHDNERVSESGECTKARQHNSCSGLGLEDGFSTEPTQRRRRWFQNRAEEVIHKPNVYYVAEMTTNIDDEIAQESELGNTSQDSAHNLVTNRKGITDVECNVATDQARRRRRWFENWKKSGPAQKPSILADNVINADRGDIEQGVDVAMHDKAGKKVTTGVISDRVTQKEKEKKVVDRAIRAARLRAFVEVRQKAAATALDQQGRASSDIKTGSDRASSEIKTGSDRASMDAKLKVERAAVERATAEARERALQKAMSEKAVYERDLNNQTFSPSCSKGYSSASFATEKSSGATSESPRRRKAISERHRRTMERAAKALEEKNLRDSLAQNEQAERDMFAYILDAEVKRWLIGKDGNLRSLLSTLQYILGPDSGWQAIPLSDLTDPTSVRKAYKRAALCVHPDKLQQRGATVQHKYICEKVFDVLKDAWKWHELMPDDI